MPNSLLRFLRARWPGLALLVLSLLLPLSRPAPATLADSGGSLPIQALGQPRMSTAADAQAQRIAPALQQAVAAVGQEDTLLPVIVVSQGALASNGILQGAIARRPDTRGLVFTSGQARAGQVSALARPVNVVAVLSGAPPQAPFAPGLENRQRPRPDHAGGEQPQASANLIPLPTFSDSAIRNPQSAIESPDSWHTVDVQDVRPAWDAGYRGGGVKVALIDSGVDFGHPDLMGTYARVEDPTSPYYGWPLAFDPTSMELYANGIVGDINNAIKAYGSWYIDTSATIHGESGIFTTVSATPNAMVPITHTYTMPGTSKSGIYHIGILPDEQLAFDRYAEYVAVVVADTHQAGVYDTVYVDLLDTHNMHRAKVLYKGHEVETQDLDHDGVPDLSTGMLYFIADGRHSVPASDWMYGLPPPENGSLVAMMGSYDYAEDHGTSCASSIVAQGIIDGPNGGMRPPYKPAGVGGMVQGMAPDAKLIAIGNVYRSGQAIYDAYTLVTYGLDGRPNSGDEPQVVSMSYGFDGGVDSGWDFQSRYIASLQQDNPQLSYVAALGNGGPGYGSGTPPAAAPNVISVGAATQYGETTTFDPISSTLDITWGDVQPWSDRGPSIIGNAGPSVVAVGAWGTADVAPNYAQHGANAYDVWGGTSMATPVTAGVLALGYEAYRQATGHWPTASTARELLASSARDLNYGAFSQGAGLVDGLRLVNLARGQAGLQVSPVRWTPGQTAPSFAGVLNPGASASTTVTLTNPTGAPLTANVGSDNLVEVGHYDWTVNTDLDNESPPSFGRPDYLQDLTGAIPANTDLMKVQAVLTYTDFTLSAPTSDFLFWHSTWRLLVYDWQDKNGDGRIWQDLNGNGAANDGEVQTGEYNRLWYSYPAGDMLEGYVNKPLSRVHDGVFIGLQHADETRSIPNTTIHLRATFYRHQAWSVLNTDQSTVVVPAHGSATVQASVQVPADEPAGVYEGSVRVTWGNGQVAVMPVALNVGLPDIVGTFGGTPPAPTTYDNGRMGGDLNWEWRADAGEWRHFYAYNPASPPPNTFFWVHTVWPHYPTDFDTFLLGAAPWDYYSVTQPDLFGPYDLWGFGGSAFLYEGGGQWKWGTNTDSTAEWVSGPLTQVGLHEVVLHNDWYSGADFAEPFTGTVGTATLSTDHISIESNSTHDSATISVTTGITLPTGLAVNGYGLSQRSVEHDLPIQAQGTYFQEIPLTNTASVEFSTTSAHPIDLYIYIDYFDGERWNWLTSSGGGGPNQYVRIEPVRDGLYRIRVDGGLNVPDGSTFDLTIKAVHGGDVSSSPALVPGPIAPGTTLTFTVSYTQPALVPGIYDGKVFVGPPEAPALVSLPMEVIYGNPTPEPTETPYPCIPQITDVSPTNWAWPYISALWCQGIVSGYLDRSFHPGARTSRVQFLAMLGRAQNWAIYTPPTPTFSDVPPTFWGYGYIETAAHYGIANGYADGTFHPVDYVNRAQVAKMIVQAADWSQTPTPGPAIHFRDVPPSYWAYPYIEAAAAHGLISGYADGTFRPAAGATRAQMAKILYQLITPAP